MGIARLCWVRGFSAVTATNFAALDLYHGTCLAFGHAMTYALFSDVILLLWDRVAGIACLWFLRGAVW